MDPHVAHLHDVETSVRRMRWVALVALPVLALTFRPPPDVVLPVDRAVFTVLMAAAILALQVASGRALASRDGGRLERFGRLSTVATLGLVAAVLFVFGVDPTSRFWPLLVVPVIEGAHRHGVAGAWAAWAGGSLIYAGEQVVHLDAKPEPGSWLSAILWGVAILAMVAGGAGTLAERSTTQRRRADRLLDEEVERNRELRQLHELRDDFTSILTHELRSPMTAINGYAILLRDRWDSVDDARREEFLEEIVQATARVTRLTRDVLQVAKAERRDLRIDLRDVDVEPLARAVATAEVARSGQHVLSVHVAPPIPAAAADPDRLEQVVQNLVSNAVKYSPEGGRVTIGLDADGDAVVLTVADDGVGIAEDDLGSVFEKFSRVGHHRGIEGTGLGLYLTRMLVEAMDGTIGVTSVEGAGTRFTVRLRSALPRPTGAESSPQRRATS